MKRRGCDPKAPQVTGDQKKRSEHDGRRRSRGAATDHRWITQRATTCGGRHARGRRRTQPPLDQAKYGRTRKPEAEGKRWKAPSLARFRSDQDDTPPPAHPATPPASARTHGRAGDMSDPTAHLGTQAVRPIDLRGSDPIRYPPSSPCSRVGRARSSDRWLALRPRKLSCGANRPRDAGAEESGCRSNKRAARGVPADMRAPFPTCHRWVENGRKFPLFSCSVFYILPPRFRIFVPESGRNPEWRLSGYGRK
jgi:hypothetical protein